LVEIQEDGVVLRLVDVDGDDDTDDVRELNEDEDGVEEDEDAARGPGQPRIEIDLADIVELRNENFRWADIARMTGLNLRTLRRWRERVNFSAGHEPMREVGDAELTDILHDFLEGHQHRGQSSARGHVASLGVRVTRARLRDEMRRIDPEAVDRRRRRERVRVPYTITVWNYLWHQDGWHKLIGWGIVVHAAVDGATRTCTFATARDNNRMTSVFESFWDGIMRYGVPWRMRGDDGGENNLVAKFMNLEGEHRFLGNLEGFIRGPSMHNTRIESFWLHMRLRCMQFWIDFFSAMSSRDVPVDVRLNTTIDAHKFVLHYLFLPHINAELQRFVNFWNSHPLSTAGQFSPNQLRVLSQRGGDEPPPPAVDPDVHNFLLREPRFAYEGAREADVVDSPVNELDAIGTAVFVHFVKPIDAYVPQAHYSDLFRTALDHYHRILQTHPR